MLLAYLDEVGESGAFISRKHKHFNTSPGFGYAGFVIPDSNAREFGAIFTKEKRILFSKEFVSAANQGAWEIKGASVFRSKTPTYAPQNIRVFQNLCRQLIRLDGRLFYYVDEKPKGTPKQVSLDQDLVERRAMEEVLNRVCTAADARGENVMFMIDAINEDQRSKRLPNMYAHILGRAADKPEMRRAVEPPMHIDSELSASIQFADWVAAVIARAVEYQLLGNDDYQWVGEALWSQHSKIFTKESKLHFLTDRSIDDLHTWDLLKRQRPLKTPGSIIADPETAQKMERLFQASRSQKKP
ncbi:DUF3800 domain-containing protein [Leucobacter insecticola]|uniref:DUF3800 domain-containing protein n=1 Tax=Leucobacter insecticola TaxID=2714934 RepID=A0A6G8FG65_9MICO|nr:DUF3800 domain-containing protein [Leucobacter insecticola]QIM15440.1 DUF3800 domain-containing protein [Leucobacter insecticola]